MSAMEVVREPLNPHALEQDVLLSSRYRVQAKLADGGAATVYRAHDLVRGGPVALKVFDPLQGADPVARARFAREFQVLVSVSHPGVARALSFEEGPHFDVLVMEWVEGELLRDRFSRGDLDWQEAVDLGGALNLALEACHAAGVVHRDLKPENIVLHPERGPVILDFGVAWFSSALTLTRTGAVLGSPRYLAPELFRSPDVDGRADLFALGAILYEGLAGRPVRSVDSMAEMAAREGPDRPPALHVLRPELRPEAWHTIERSLAYRPEDRFATAQEFGAALAGTALSLGRRLEDRLSCEACGTALVIELPICPGCGQGADWRLESGPFAVQLHEVRSPQATAAWLQRRYSSELVSRRWLQRRLLNPPVPLVVGVSERSAESLAAQATELGCRAEILRGRAVVGPALRMASASPAEIMAACAAHFSAVMAAGVGASLMGLSQGVLVALPGAIGVAGIAGARRYARRALLQRVQRPKQVAQAEALKELRGLLGQLRTSRARRLAAGAVARAAPVLLGQDRGLSAEAIHDVQDGLRIALGKVIEVDTFQRALQERPRAELRARLTAAETQAPEQVPQLEAELQTLTEAALAHDLAVRQALEACRDISSAMSTRVLGPPAG